MKRAPSLDLIQFESGIFPSLLHRLTYIFCLICSFLVKTLFTQFDADLENARALASAVLPTHGCGAPQQRAYFHILRRSQQALPFMA